MLRQLSIQNFALIEDLEIDLRKGLTTITGETGAGKSIILGAIALLTGNRADLSMIVNKSKKCIIEAEFNIMELGLQKLFEEREMEYSDTAIIRREFNKDGKSRVFVNDSPVALLHLREIVNRILDVHSQHENLDLASRKYQLSSLDIYGGLQKELEYYREEFLRYRQLTDELEQMTEESVRLRENTEYMSHQLNELVDAGLEADEQESLETELNVLNHAEEIRSYMNQIDQILNRQELNPVDSIIEVQHLVRKCHDHMKEMKELDHRMESLVIELEDIRRELSALSESETYHPDRLAIVEDRLSEIYRLQQKHRVNRVTDLLNIKEKLEGELENIGNIDNRLEELTRACNKAGEKVNSLAAEISKKRQKAGEQMGREVREKLESLGMKNCRFSIQFSDADLGADGIDKVEFLFSANKGVDARPVSKVASGGELSRLMLSIKSALAQKAELPCLILDEIDSGISGEVADKMGRIIKEMSKVTQVIAITHLPQIAAMGDRQFKVYKRESGERSETRIDEITGKERTAEIARLLSGEGISKEAMENARVLLESR